MNEEKPSFNILDMFRIGYKKPTPEGKKYSNFNRRMFAFTVDSILLMILVAPLVDYVFAALYGPFPIDLAQLSQDLQAAISDEERKRVWLHAIVDSGALKRWLYNAFTQMVVLLILSGIFWYYWAATPGKMLMRMKIVDAKTEQPISLPQIALRLGGYMISTMFFMLGFFWIGVDKRKQGWHDKLADTVVINLPFKKKSTPDSAVVDP